MQPGEQVSSRSWSFLSGIVQSTKAADTRAYAAERGILTAVQRKGKNVADPHPERKPNLRLQA
jgi:hypothetical protein